jgi:hypothetical protein
MERAGICLGIMALFIASPAVGEAPYIQGRLAHPAYAEIAGRPDQIADIKVYAVAHGWEVVCDQAASGLSTIRLRLPAGTSQESIDGYLQGGLRQGHMHKIQMIYYGMHTAAPRCILLP